MNRLPLDDDIIDRIFTFLPTFADLQAAILTSKAFYQVFETRPNSTMRAVAYNVVGPALPQALRVLRFHLSQNISYEMCYNKNLPAPESNYDIERFILPKETFGLVENVKAVRGLEDLFSLRHKDRRFESSQLSPEESHRFQSAMYRVMLYCKVFSYRRYRMYRGFIEDRGAVGIDPQVFEEREVVLSDYGTKDLYEILSLSFFLKDIIQDTIEVFDVEDSNELDTILSIGPSSIYYAFKDSVVAFNAASNDVDESLDPMDLQDTYPSFCGYISKPIEFILEQREGKKVSRDDDEVRYTILKAENIRGEHDCCDQCGQDAGFDLFGPSTYNYFGKTSRVLHVSTLRSLLPGKLRFNTHDRFNSYLTQDFWQDRNEIAFVAVLEWIYDGHKSSEFEAWNKDDWLCEDCVQHILSAHLHVWLLDLMIKNGEAVLEDCWYGYNCRTQTHSQHHATRLNHLCVQTRFR